MGFTTALSAIGSVAGLLGSRPQNPQTNQDFTNAGIQQGIDNQNAAQFNTNLNRLNQFTPGGSLTYGTDASGTPYQAMTLTPQQQVLYNNSQNLAGGIGLLANSALNQGYNTIGQGQVTRDMTGSGLQMAPGGSFVTGSNPNGVQYGSAGTPSNPQVVQGYNGTTTGMAGGAAGNEVNPAGGLTQNQVDAINNPGGTNGGNTPAQPVAPVAPPTPIGHVTPGQAAASQAAALAQASLTRADPASLATAGSAAGDYAIQRTFDRSGVRALPGTIDDASRRRVEEAIMSRINPQYANDEAALRSRMLNSGIEVGTNAYNREMQNFSQRLNDARMQAVLAGGQEESRQVGLTQSLNAQEYDQALKTGQFGQAADTSMAGNRTQRDIANAQMATQVALANAGFLNQNNLANAGAANTLSQFNTGAANDNSQFNVGQTNSVNLANAGFTTNANIASANNATQLAANAASNATSSGNASAAASSAERIAAGNQALQGLSINNAAHMQNITEQLAIRDQSLQEMQMLQQMSLPTMPTFGGYYTGGNAAATPTLQAAMGAAGNFQNQQQQATNNSGMFSTLLNAGNQLFGNQQYTLGGL